MHSMTCRTDGIESTAPVRWRSYEGMCGVYWQARGETGATGYYRSPDPRIMLFFNDVSGNIRLTDRRSLAPRHWRPMLRALYVPAGVPMWTRFGSGHVFSHLDLHLDHAWLVARLAPMMRGGTAEEALRHPVEVQDIGTLASVARALTEEISAPSRGPVFAESLAVALVAGMIGPRAEAPLPPPGQGGLSPRQMRRLLDCLAAAGGRRLSNAELAAAVGLSEGWFCRAFKKTTGKTPLHWQQERRLCAVKEELRQAELTIAEIALRHDFSDQGHLTRVFRKYEGTTPGAWQKAQRGD
ncbi:AraC family transcriptional regulator (plasmid) [Salipiger sp. H15]|uniref:AraC family transcriptional regulator n=1 Tax=Alloyangia sp. H15 TaxID=3029062 RepID=A0AAU8ARY8_9RHOB